jgi:hypothetical protein
VKVKGREENDDGTGKRKGRERIRRETYKRGKAEKKDIIFHVTFDR